MGGGAGLPLGPGAQSVQTRRPEPPSVAPAPRPPRPPAPPSWLAGASPVLGVSAAPWLGGGLQTLWLCLICLVPEQKLRIPLLDCGWG